MSILNQVTKSSVYSGLNSVQKRMTTTKQNLGVIKHGLTVAGNIGLDQWKKICGFSERNIRIVEELHDNESEKLTQKAS